MLTVLRPRTATFKAFHVLTFGMVISISLLYLIGCSNSLPAKPNGATEDADNHAAEMEMKMAPVANPSANSPAAVNQVTIDNFAFNPKTLTVSVGTEVTWINRDDVPHTATSAVKPRVFDSKTLDIDDKFSHVFTALGTYQYFCAVHPHMTGEIVVK